MIQSETIENLTGFGSKNAKGEAFLAENMIPGQFGLEANITIKDETATGTLARFNWFAEKTGTDAGVFAADTNGLIWKRTAGNWAVANSPSSSHGNGLIATPDGRLLYARDAKLGVYDGSLWADDSFNFGATVTDFRPMELYQDWVVIGNGNALALYNMFDSSFTANGFSLPGNAVVRAIKANQTGLLVGANTTGNQSFIFLWDARSIRSISEWIWFDAPIQSICKYGARWIVTTQTGQYITDGYSITAIPSPADAIAQNTIFTCTPAGTKVVGNSLYTSNSTVLYNRMKSGLYIQDLQNGQFSYATVDNSCKTDMTMGSIHQDSSLNFYISYSTNLPSAHHVALLTNATPDFATLIYPRLGNTDNQKVADGFKLDVTLIPEGSSVHKSGGFTAALKIYNFKRPLWGYGVTNAASSNTTTIKVDGSISGKNNAMVGDEVTVLSGVNAGQVRHITAIANENTNTEIWTLDSALPNNMESGAYFNVQPFQLIKTKAFSFSTLAELESIYFPIRNKIRGRKFLAKIVFTDISGITLAESSGTFTYNDLGIV